LKIGYLDELHCRDGILKGDGRRDKKEKKREQDLFMTSIQWKGSIAVSHVLPARAG